MSRYLLTPVLLAFALIAVGCNDAPDEEVSKKPATSEVSTSGDSCSCCDSKVESESCCKDGETCSKDGASCCKDGETCSKDGASCCKDGGSCNKEGESCCKDGQTCDKEGTSCPAGKCSEGKECCSEKTVSTAAKKDCKDCDSSACTKCDDKSAAAKKDVESKERCFLSETKHTRNNQPRFFAAFFVDFQYLRFLLARQPNKRD